MPKERMLDGDLLKKQVASFSRRGTPRLEEVRFSTAEVVAVNAVFKVHGAAQERGTSLLVDGPHLDLCLRVFIDRRHTLVHVPTWNVYFNRRTRVTPGQVLLYRLKAEATFLGETIRVISWTNTDRKSVTDVLDYLIPELNKRDAPSAAACDKLALQEKLNAIYVEVQALWPDAEPDAEKTKGKPKRPKKKSEKPPTDEKPAEGSEDDKKPTET